VIVGRRSLAFLAAALLGPASAFLVSCGDRSALIPGEDADRLKSDLEHVQNAIIDGRCDVAQRAADQVALDARAIPATVDQRLQQAVNEGAGALQTQVPEQCEEGKTETETQTQETQPTETQTQPTEPTPTETAPAPTPEPPILPPPPGDGGGGDETGGGITVPVDPGVDGEEPAPPSGSADAGSGAPGGSG
jgi:hypothetical protein